tara:strand:+ start:10863 stop:12749 length:1887 start_codon:yes stop_codon:yes gene_type:complete
MANKIKNKKILKESKDNEQYLLQDEELGEIEKKTYIEYDLENDTEEFEKELEKKPENVKINPETGTATIEEDNLKEVEKSQILKYDIKKSSDVKALQQMLDKGVESEKITIGTDGTISISESIKNPTRIITAESFKKMVNNFNKIDLSESEILSILKETQNPIMKKSELMETIQNNLISEAQMNDNVRQNFESGSHDYSEVINTDLARNLADESFDEIAQKIREKTGNNNVTIDDVQRLMSNSLMNAAKQEYQYGIERLEQKAVEMIKKQFNIPNDAVDFEATITGLPPQMLVGRDVSPQEAEDLSRQVGAKVSKINREGLKMERGTSEVPQGKSEDELKPKIKRRRLTNAMMHGAARKSQNLHHMDDQLRQENPQLGQNYANVMTANDASYWMLNDDTIREQGQQGIHAGNARIQLSSEEGGKPKVIAQGMIFPILLHELTKGVIELMSLWSLPKDRDVRQYVLDKTDNLESETNDIRLGPAIWTKFVEQIPVDNQEVISLTWNMLQELSDHDFNSIIDGLLSDSTDAQTKVNRMAQEALDELQREASEDTFGGYEDSPEQEDDGDVLTPPEPEGGREVTPTPEIDEPEEIDYESLSTRELQRSLDDALDSGDMDLVRHIGSILNSR